MHRYDRGWSRGYYYPSASVPYDRLYRHGPAPRRPYRGKWALYDDDLYGRWNRPRGFQRYGPYSGRGQWDRDRARSFRYPEYFTPRGYDEPDVGEPLPRAGYGREWQRAYDDPGQRRNSTFRRPYGRPSLERYADDWSAWTARPENGWRRWGRSGRWERPAGYIDEGIEGYVDDLEEGDPDDFPAFEDPYPAWDEPSDEEVYEAVRQSLAGDGFLDGGKIQVEVKDRVVTLRGEVADYMEARYAWDDAWEAPGVRGVISKLTVTDPAPAGGSAPDAATEATRTAAPEARQTTGKDDPDQE